VRNELEIIRLTKINIFSKNKIIFKVYTTTVLLFYRSLIAFTSTTINKQVEMMSFTTIIKKF
jgi:hypothetical protein